MTPRERLREILFGAALKQVQPLSGFTLRVVKDAAEDAPSKVLHMPGPLKKLEDYFNPLEDMPHVVKPVKPKAAVPAIDPHINPIEEMPPVVPPHKPEVKEVSAISTTGGNGGGGGGGGEEAKPLIPLDEDSKRRLWIHGTAIGGGTLAAGAGAYGLLHRNREQRFEALYEETINFARIAPMKGSRKAVFHSAKAKARRRALDKKGRINQPVGKLETADQVEVRRANEAKQQSDAALTRESINAGSWGAELTPKQKEALSHEKHRGLEPVVVERGEVTVDKSKPKPTIDDWMGNYGPLYLGGGIGALGLGGYAIGKSLRKKEPMNQQLSARDELASIISLGNLPKFILEQAGEAALEHQIDNLRHRKKKGCKGGKKCDCKDCDKHMSARDQFNSIINFEDDFISRFNRRREGTPAEPAPLKPVTVDVPSTKPPKTVGATHQPLRAGTTADDIHAIHAQLQDRLNDMKATAASKKVALPKPPISLQPTPAQQLAVDSLPSKFKLGTGLKIGAAALGAGVLGGLAYRHMRKQYEEPQEFSAREKLSIIMFNAEGIARVAAEEVKQFPAALKRYGISAAVGAGIGATGLIGYHMLKRKKKEERLSARDQLNSIINLAADPRPRTRLGEFKTEEGEINPNNIHTAYKAPKPEKHYGTDAAIMGGVAGAGVLATGASDILRHKIHGALKNKAAAKFMQ